MAPNLVGVIRALEAVRERVLCAYGMAWPGGPEQVNVTGQMVLEAMQELEARIQKERRRAEDAEIDRHNAVQFIERQNYRRCDDPRCNCDSWHPREHGPGFYARFKELERVIRPRVDETPLAALNRRFREYEDFVGILYDWSHRYGELLKPPGGSADSYGDGVRACKARVAELLADHYKRQQKGGPYE